MRRLQIPGRRYGRVFAPDLSGGVNGFSDSRVLPFDRGEAAFNISLERGSAENGYGIVGSSISSEYTRLYYYKSYDEDKSEYTEYLLCYDAANKRVRAYDGENWTDVEGAEFALAPMGVNYRLYGEDVYLMCGEEGMAVVKPDLRAVKVGSAPNITSVTMHNERMFATVGGRRNAVWFSDDLDPTNWNPELDEGGFIELEGEQGRLNKALSFGGYVYVFRDYGIARLSALGSQSDFSVTNLFVSSGRIYGNTVMLCGDRVLFYADDGLYSFNGLTATRICRGVDGILPKCENTAACYFGGRYYLAAGEFTLVADPLTKRASVSRGQGIVAFSPVVHLGGETLFAYVPGKPVLGKVEKGAGFFGEEVERVWRSGMTDLGIPERRKLIGDVFLDTKYDCFVTVSTESKTKTVRFRGKKGTSHKRINLLGNVVCLEIKAFGDISAARPLLRYTAI